MSTDIEKNATTTTVQEVEECGGDDCGVKIPPSSVMFSTDGWCKSKKGSWWQWYNFKAYQSINGIFSVGSINALFGLAACNCLFCMLSVNSLFSILSVNSTFSVLSSSSMFAVGCSGESFKVCFGNE
eukprot:jgi/Psemu1/290479/fgenesh1_pg.505_\